MSEDTLKLAQEIVEAEDRCDLTECAGDTMDTLYDAYREGAGKVAAALIDLHERMGLLQRGDLTHLLAFAGIAATKGTREGGLLAEIGRLEIVRDKIHADLTAAQQKLAKAMDLLDRASSRFEDATPPDATWYKELFLLTGEHMILTEEGWAGGESKASQLEECGEESILDEVNAPA